MSLSAERRWVEDHNFLAKVLAPTASVAQLSCTFLIGLGKQPGATYFLTASVAFLSTLRAGFFRHPQNGAYRINKFFRSRSPYVDLHYFDRPINNRIHPEQSYASGALAVSFTSEERSSVDVSSPLRLQLRQTSDRMFGKQQL